MKSVIMDLRGNPGGLLTASVDVADKFIDQGSIVSTHGRQARRKITTTRPGPPRCGMCRWWC